MAFNVRESLSVREYIQRAKNPKYLDIIFQEYLNVNSISIKGTCDNFYLQKNKKKNRNMKYPCWDISRVVLKSNNHLDYINANYMAGFDGRRKFIVTQEPMAKTFNDFWSMIWEENSRIIVMLNDTKQELQPTSPQYLCVNQDHAILKQFIIKEESIRVESHFMYTKLRILHRSSKDSRVIHHFKYFDWTETNAPDERLILDFLLKVNNQDQYYFKRTILTNQCLAKPIVVHSNLGIGRAAAFCIADICLYQIIHTLKVAVPLMVLKARQQRRFSIPTFNHYVFIHNFILYFLTIVKVNPRVFFDFCLHLTNEDKHLFLLK